MAKYFEFAAPLVLLSLVSNPEEADWHCTNDVEVACVEDSCTVYDPEETSTIHVYFSVSGEFSVCAYSGCWDGKGKVATTAPFLIIWKEQADWNFSPDREKNRKDVLIAFDVSDQVALVKVGALASPFNCSSNKLSRSAPNKSLHSPPDASVTALAFATAAPDAGACELKR
jgi:hypothetical protein